MNAESEYIESYWSILKTRSDKAKLELVERLQKSLSKSNPEKKDCLKETFGAWEGPELAEEIIESISSSRNFNRNQEEF